MLIGFDSKTYDCLRSTITEPGPLVFYPPSDRAETHPLNIEREKTIYLSILKKMVHLQPKHLRKYLLSCDSDVILILYESLHNVLLGHVRVKVSDLQKYRRLFEDVLKKSLMDKGRAVMLTKTGFKLIQHIIKFCFVHLSSTMSSAEEFILIPENQFMKEERSSNIPHKF